MHMRIGELAKKTNCLVETVRYYERIDLMLKPVRSESGHRIYDQKALKRLHFIRNSREIGLTLKEIRSLLTLVENEKVTCPEVENFTEDHLRRVHAKIEDLLKLETSLKNLLTQCGTNKTFGCPIIDALFEG